MLIALHGSPQQLEDILFGDPKTIDRDMLGLMAGVTSVTLLTLAVIYRPLVVKSFDPIFMRAVRGRGGIYHALFMALVVLNMVEGYRALGTLMASGLLIIPAVISQFWLRRLAGRRFFDRLCVGCLGRGAVDCGCRQGAFGATHRVNVGRYLCDFIPCRALWQRAGALFPLPPSRALILG